MLWLILQNWGLTHLELPLLVRAEEDVCAGTMVQLASKGEAGLIKLSIPIIPMLDDFEYASSRASMLQAESDGVGTMEKAWQAIGGPEFETQRSAGDPLLFPAKAIACGALDENAVGCVNQLNPILQISLRAYIEWLKEVVSSQNE